MRHTQIDAVMCSNRKGLIVGCLIVLSVVSVIVALILSIVEVKNVYKPSPNKYGIVFDAGSSHTSMYVYQWPADKENDTGVVGQVHICEVQGPGISSYADNPAQAGLSLRPCMEEALSIIPSSQHKETTTLLGATAGMRLLSVTSPKQTQELFGEVSKTLRQYQVNFQGARILTGSEEGSLGWITVNYIVGTLLKHTFVGSWVHPKGQTFGAMDLGGASTQMTFVPSVSIKDKNTEMQFRLYGYNYTVYTHSYLCYGQDQIFKRLLAALIQEAKSENITHPCYPKHYITSVSPSSVYNSPCITTTAIPRQNFTVIGSGDPGMCYSFLRQIMNFTSCSIEPCSFDGIYQPPVHGEFYKVIPFLRRVRTTRLAGTELAFSAFYYTLNFMNLTSGQSLSVANRTIQNFCTSEWKKLQEDFPLEKKDRLLHYCTSGVYILTLLLDGYNFTEHTWSNIHFTQKVDNTNVGWTLGYMLNLTNRIPSEAPVLLKGHSYNLWVAALFFIVLSIVAGLVAAPLHCFRRNKCSGQGAWT